MTKIPRPNEVPIHGIELVKQEKTRVVVHMCYARSTPKLAASFEATFRLIAHEFRGCDFDLVSGDIVRAAVHDFQMGVYQNRYVQKDGFWDVVLH